LFLKYYQSELRNLRELALEFSKTHPDAAPMLSGPKADPDVERLLEGVAFLNGLLHQKLDDELPEIVYSLMELVFPHYLRPIPSMSIVMFEAKKGTSETIVVPAGTSLGSVPLDGTRCTFKTCYDTEVHPVRLLSLTTDREPGKPGSLSMSFELTGFTLAQWKPKSLAFFLGGAYAQAADLFTLMVRHLGRITLKPQDAGDMCVLDPAALVPVGFDPKRTLFPFPLQSFTGFRLLQEFFLMPLKFMFMELRGWEQWNNRGKGTKFDVVFEFSPSSIPLPTLTASEIVLFATPVINLVKMEAEPTTLDHRTERIHVRPPLVRGNHVRVYSVEKVTGFTQGSVKRKDYVPIGFFNRSQRDNPTYQATRSWSPVDDSMQVYLSFPYSPEEGNIEEQTLSMDILCTNGTLPERLQFGDISVQTADSPELVTFKNVIAPTATIEPPREKDVLWRFLSHLSLNYLPVADTGNLKELLGLYVFPEGRDRSRIESNMRQVAGITKVTVTPVRRLLKGNMVHGQKIEVVMSKAHFASMGGLYLFASVLNQFFQMYSAMHTLVQFSVTESSTGETFLWPERMGGKWLI
jgi:type VI secretion system protein ImpG